MRIRFIFFFFAVFSSAIAQNPLTIEDAINIALKNNFDILVARNEADINSINNTAGNAGMMPNFTITGNGNYEMNNVHQELSGGENNDIVSLSKKAVNAGTELNWTLFDGGKMFVTKNKLNEIEALGEIQFKDQVLKTLYNVIAAYYDIVRQKQQLASINELINFNRERVKITQTGYTAGSLIKPDLLLAKIDLNVTMELAINQQYVIEAARKNLIELLNLSTDEIFEVSDSIPIDSIPESQALLEKLNSTNTSILSFRKQMDIARLKLKENKSLYSPTINLRGGYYLSQNNYSEGSQLENRVYGPLIGGSINIPLYNSGDTRRKVSIAKIDLQSAEYNLQNAKLQAIVELKNAITDFENQQKLLHIEEENILLARENLDISLQRLRLGQTTSLEVRQSEEDYVKSFTRLINFKYNLKIAETKVKQLVAQL